MDLQGVSCAVTAGPNVAIRTTVVIMMLRIKVRTYRSDSADNVDEKSHLQYPETEDQPETNLLGFWKFQRGKLCKGQNDDQHIREDRQ